jgi:Aminopeptidase N
MNIFKSVCLIGFVFFFLNCFSQSDIDVLHYSYQIELTDLSDTIHGTATILLNILKPVDRIVFDLTSASKGKGMTVSTIEGEDLNGFIHANNQLIIKFKHSINKGNRSYTIHYAGVPSDGLIISKNKYGDRTFFADNWPNRAHNWIPCIDWPKEKATFEFTVTAPATYKVISNGELVEEKLIGENKRLTHWKENVSLSSKVMVIGAARFAVKEFKDQSTEVPVSAWVYPQDSVKGFYDYGVIPSILQFFINYIAPFPYNKLANVQSKTMFGGMENASAIFYAEASVTGDRKWEDVFAHEVAHQWFGDMASEKTFAHLWLSEGFATYMTDVYFENKYGKEKAAERLKKERNEIIEFVKTSNHPVVDTTSNLMYLLNVNSYQKGGWVLHMLRQETGDSVFHKIIQTYYNSYKGSNANTEDFEKIAEKVSGKNLNSFFQQWLYRGGIPKLKIVYELKNDEVEVEVIQQNKPLYTHLPLQIKIELENGTSILHTVMINEELNRVKIKTTSKPVGLAIDPNVNLLFEKM